MNSQNMGEMHRLNTAVHFYFINIFQNMHLSKEDLFFGTTGMNGLTISEKSSSASYIMPIKNKQEFK